MYLFNLMPILVIVTLASGYSVRQRAESSQAPTLMPHGSYAPTLALRLMNTTSTDAICVLCELVVETLQFLNQVGVTGPQLADTATALCRKLNLFPYQDCRRLGADFVEEVAYIMRNTNHSSREVCSYYFSNTNECQAPNFFANFNWSVEIPGKVPPLLELSQDYCQSKNATVLHISDIHIDRRYTEGTKTDCTSFICCQENTGWANWFENGAGKFGGGERCDIPLVTAQTALEFARNNFKPQFILWTGDIPPHDIFSQTKAGNMQQIVNQVALLQRYFPTTPIYPALGNHEPEPLNAFIEPSMKTRKYNQDYLYQRLDASWRGLFPNYNSTTVLLGGFYSANFNARLKIISLNTNFGSMENWFLLIKDEDPAGQLKWLIGELQSAEQNHQKAIIIAHIPPSLLSYTWGRNFNNIKNRFKNVIAGEYYGHTHLEQLEITYDESDAANRPVSGVAYIGPSVTTYGNNNPAFKIMTLDGNSYIPCESETYFLNLTEANYRRVAEWKLLFKATTAYGLKSFHPSEINDFSERLKTDPELLHEYYTNQNRKADLTPCIGKCVEKITCAMQSSWGGAKLLC